MDAQWSGTLGNGWAALGMTSPGIIDTLAGLGIIASGHPGVRRRAECRPGEVSLGGLLNMEKQGNLPRIRIAWKAGKDKSYGKWQAPSCREWMQGVIERLHRDYGPGTHWIEEEALRRKPRMHRTLHGDYVCFCEAVAGRAPTPEVAYADWKKAMRRYASPGYWEAHFPDEPQSPRRV